MLFDEKHSSTIMNPMTSTEAALKLLQAEHTALQEAHKKLEKQLKRRGRSCNKLKKEKNRLLKKIDTLRGKPSSVFFS